MNMNSVIGVVMLVMMMCLSDMNGWFMCFGESNNEDDESMSNTSSDILAPMKSEEKMALYKVVKSFVGDWWNGSLLYPDPCGWTPILGVSCDLYDGLWYVTALNIGQVHENSLSCATSLEFNPQLFDLNHLKSLSFSNCFTSLLKHPVSIPTRDWEKLADSLETLEFRSNPRLIGSIPTSLGRLVKLKSLVLIENGLTGEIPASIGNLVNLERLVLAGNKLSSQIPDSFGGLSQLLIIDLSENSLSGALPLSLGSLTSLLKLDLSHNLLEGNLSIGFQSMTNLTLLDLSNNKLSGGLAKMSDEIVKPNSLEQIVLSNNPIGGELKSLEFEKLERLSILDLSNTGLSGEIPDSISKLQRIRFLGLSHNNLSGNLSPELENIPSVGALYLNGNNLSGELEFSEGFYGKMGSRFGAWDNPNLCYKITIGLSQNNGNVPFGVKPCQSGYDTVEHLAIGRGDLGNKESLLVNSLGLSINPFHGLFWWILLVSLSL